MTAAAAPATERDDDALPRWSVADLHESLNSRSFTSALEAMGATVQRAVAVFDEHRIGTIGPRPVEPADADTIDAALEAVNDAAEQLRLLFAYIHATVATDSRHEQAQALLSEVQAVMARATPLRARLADWVNALETGSGRPGAVASLSATAAEHEGPLRRLAEGAAHQMSEPEENLYAELSTTGPAAWSRLHRDVTSQLTADVAMPDGSVERLPMPAVRGLANSPDPATRRGALDAELTTWPSVTVTCAAALNAIKGDANAVDRRRHWDSPLDASLFANSVSRPTFDAMQAAVDGALDDFRSWMRTKASLHLLLDDGDSPPNGTNGGIAAGLHWADLMAPLPLGTPEITWDEGIGLVREAFGGYGPQLGSLVDRALEERWIDVAPRDGKTGGAFCMPFVGDRSLVLLNWAGSADSAQTTAHELGHAYHNTTLAERTPLQRNLPMALAETASIFCETLMVEHGLAQLDGADRLAVLDVDLVGANQVVVDIRSRFLFETEVFTRRAQRTLGVSELNALMGEAQAEAYGDGLDQATAHPYMWAVKPHYYGSHFYNWPYCYGLLFGLGLFARYREDPEHFRSGYETLLSRAGMDTAEELGAQFGFDVTDEAFWVASLDVIRSRIADYEQLAADVTSTVTGQVSSHVPSGAG